MAQLPVWAKVRRVLASVQAARGGVTQDTPAQASAHAPWLQEVAQVLSTGSYWHTPATQRPAKVRTVLPFTQLDWGGVLQLTVAQDGSTAVEARHTPSRQA